MIHCDRCRRKADGFVDADGTSGGCYDVSPGSFWDRYARPYESVICDRCMWCDPRWVADYGSWQCENAKRNDEGIPC